jgi:hypothetical protein
VALRIHPESPPPKKTVGGLWTAILAAVVVSKEMRLLRVLEL